MSAFDQHFAVVIDRKDCLTCYETLEEWFFGEVFIVFLEMLLGRGYQLDSGKLVAMGLSGKMRTAGLGTSFVPSLLEPRNDITDESTLCKFRVSIAQMLVWMVGILGHHRV